MLNDLAALTPPFLVAAAFLIAVVAFLRREMRDVKKPAEDERTEVPVDNENLADQPGRAGSGHTSRSGHIEENYHKSGPDNSGPPPSAR